MTTEEQAIHAISGAPINQRSALPQCSSNWRRRRAVAVCTAILGELLCPAAFGQGPMSPQRAAELDAHLANFRIVMAQAKTDALSPVAVEQRVASLNKAAVGSSAWHLELAQRLLHVASDVAAEGNARAVRGLADRALFNANLAASLSRKAEQQAAAKTLAGIILENYHADAAGAARAYAEAVDLNPRTNQAREKLARIQARAATGGGPR